MTDQIFQKIGIEEFVICTDYKGDKIEEHLELEKLVKTHYSHETEPLGTGETIKNAAIFLDNEERFFVINEHRFTQRQ